MSAGLDFRAAINDLAPLPVVGTVNAYTALMAKRLGHRAIYLSGAGVANASYGLPDLGVTTLNDVLIDAERITNACDLPLLVDIDTGFGGAFSIARTIKSMIKVGVSAVHMEDQVAQKRCGHRPNKALVSTAEMCDRIKAAVDAKTDPQFVIMARTDALASEGKSAAIDRACAYIEAGADMLFAEAVTDIADYAEFKSAVNAPILANITEFGQTPLWSNQALGEQGVDMVLYPLSAFRAMNKAAESVYQTILQEGSQAGVLDAMQTRETLYDYLGYHAYEDKLDTLFKEHHRG